LPLEAAFWERDYGNLKVIDVVATLYNHTKNKSPKVKVFIVYFYKENMFYGGFQIDEIN
jgi:hypothetical protein